jgi:uncharacterized protein YjbI with pentapeptide repeats
MRCAGEKTPRGPEREAGFSGPEKENFMKRYSMLVLAGLLLMIGIVWGCDSSISTGSGGAESLEAKGLVEKDFVNDPGLHANPKKGVVLAFLESIYAAEEDNLTGSLGMDIIPYYYSEAVTQTFCWEEPDPGAGHRIVLVDESGQELLEANAGGECQTVHMERGRYFLHLYHDNQGQDIHPVFIQPREDGQELAQRNGPWEKMLAWLGIFSPTGTAMAAGSDDELQTFLSTGHCIGCDLEGMDLSGFIDCGDNDDGWGALTGSNLDNATAGVTICYYYLADISGRYADFSNAYLFMARFGEADLTGANMQGIFLFGAQLDNTDMTSADLTGADLELALLTGAKFTDAILDQANLINAIDANTADFSGASLKGTIFSGLDLSTPGLLTGLDATGADFSGATIQDVNMLFVNFTDADFTGADLTGFGCLDCTLTGADLTGADLTGATMDYTGSIWTDGACVCDDSSCSNC